MKLHVAIPICLTLFHSLSAKAQALPNDAVVEGKTIAEWSAEWWKWVLPISTNQNPMLDTTGASASVGQPGGDVFFVALTLGLSRDRATRRFTVPEGKYLFLPLTLYEADNVDTVPPLAVEALRDQAAGIMNSVRELHASIDGMDVPNLFDHRASSPVFNLLYADADNLHSFAFGHPVTGLIDPMICDGYWLMIEPLPPGPHVLHFGGSLSNVFFFPADVIANLTVEPVALAARVEELIASVAASNLPRKHLRPLLATLKVAAKSFDRGHARSGIRHLRAFQKKARHEITRTDHVLAEQFIAAAQQIIDRANQDLKSVHKK